MSLHRYLVGRPAARPNPGTAVPWHVERRPAASWPAGAWETVAEYDGRLDMDQLWRELRGARGNEIAPGDLVLVSRGDGVSSGNLAAFGYAGLRGVDRLPPIDRLPGMRSETTAWIGQTLTNWPYAWAEASQPWWFVLLLGCGRMDPARLARATCAILRDPPGLAPCEDPQALAALAGAEALLALPEGGSPEERFAVAEAGRVVREARSQSLATPRAWARAIEAACTAAFFGAAFVAGPAPRGTPLNFGYVVQAFEEVENLAWLVRQAPSYHAGALAALRLWFPLPAVLDAVVESRVGQPDEGEESP